VPAVGDFEAAVPAWRATLGTLREVIRQEVLADQLRALVGPSPQRVLDVGCGQGTQAIRLASLGHDVTGLDPSADLLAELDGTPVRAVHGSGEDAAVLTPGPFDLLCCHGVLMYLTDPLPLLQAVTEVAAPRRSAVAAGPQRTRSRYARRTAGQHRSNGGRVRPA
jgi:S-adenosylmethionine-dependent methyltransferase